METFTITNRFTDETIYSGEHESLKDAVASAVADRTDLRDADLSGADLSGADLSGAYLRDAYLRGADLRGADLSGADLSGAYLSDADLSGADLSGADLSGAYLRGADLTTIRDDFWAVLCASPKEVDGLREALMNGKVDGSVYSGDCACLVGTIAKVAHCDYTELPLLRPQSGRPAERWFLAIEPGDTPDNSAIVKQTVEWLDTFTEQMRAAFGVKEKAK